MVSTRRYPASLHAEPRGVAPQKGEMTGSRGKPSGMDQELLTRISLDHRRRLVWFEDHKGEVTGMPAPLDGGLLLASKPKGIYKPKNLDYALSIRVNVGSPYDDGTPVPTPGGGWLLSYHQEGTSPVDRDRLSANRGLMRCIEDRIPVGVLQALGPARHRSQYQVLGLAMPVRWADGHFFLESLDPLGDPDTDIIADTLEAAARAGFDEALGDSLNSWRVVAGDATHHASKWIL